jgi:hypothetical protein
MLSPGNHARRLNAEQFEVVGMSPDSHSLSLADQSLNQGSQARRRRLKKQKEDLDGSRVYRDIDMLEESDKDQSKKNLDVQKKESSEPIVKKKKNTSPIRNNFVKSLVKNSTTSLKKSKISGSKNASLDTVVNL